MNIVKQAFLLKRERNWPKVYVAVDLHGVVLTPTYSRFNEGAELYPGALDVLMYWTLREDVCLILWSSSHEDAIKDIRSRLNKMGILFDHVNSNPEQPSTGLCDFSGKFYMDIILDDKAGFEGATDWLRIKEALRSIDEYHGD